MRARLIFFVGVVMGMSISVASKASSPVLSGGYSHSCSLESGRVECWGDNQFGQLGDGTTTRSLVPKAVPGITTAIQVTTGFFHTCALLQDGSVVCWGRNDAGQLGLGVANAMELGPQPAQIGGPNIAITAGGGHTCALNAEGKAYCWGYNDAGQVGKGFTSASESTPAAVPGTYDAIEAGGYHTCGLSQGLASCWGWNARGQAGTGALGGNVLIPTQVVGGNAFIKLSAGYEHTCAVSIDLAAFCWGSNDAGELGIGVAGTDSASPVGVTGLDAVSDITAGLKFACALSSEATVECWGRKGHGELGDGLLGGNNPQSFESAPVSVYQLSGVSALGSARGSHVCTTTPAGRRCWGDNSLGQVGQGLPPEDTATAMSVDGAVDVAALASQDYHTCALTDSGTVRCWGANDSGQLGQSHTRNLPVPVTVAGIGVAQALAVGHHHACALNTIDEVYCWGHNGSGQLGVGDTDPHLGPQKVIGLAPGIFQLAAGRQHTCALHSDRHISCWGNNQVGQLGNGSSDAASPVPVALDSAVAFDKVVAGADHGCALTASDAVMCWGSNYDGQLGEGDLVPEYSASPVAVQNSAGASQLVAGQFHTCLLVSDQIGLGIVKCWGNDSAGQLGNGPATTAPMPAPVTSYSGFVSELFAGGYGTCLRQPISTITCWGSSTRLQFGSGSIVHAPADVVGLQGLSSLAIGRDHVCGVDATGQAKCTGAADFGQRGDGSLALVPYPVDVVDDRLFANGFE
jgi:alpha-tubulin suppressor-like RCC1 family protein